MENRLLNTKQAAEYVGLQAVTLSKKRCYDAPNQPAYIRLGGAIRYRVTDLDDWIESNTVRATSH